MMGYPVGGGEGWGEEWVASRWHDEGFVFLVSFTEASSAKERPERVYPANKRDKTRWLRYGSHNSHRHKSQRTTCMGSYSDQVALYYNIFSIYFLYIHIHISLYLSVSLLYLSYINTRHKTCAHQRLRCNPADGLTFLQPDWPPIRAIGVTHSF